MVASDYVGVFDVTTPTRVDPLRGAFNGGPDLQHVMESPDHLISEPGDGALAQSDELTATLRARPSSFRRIKDGLARTILIIEQAGKPKLFSFDDVPPLEAAEGAWATGDYGSFNQSRINWNNLSGPYGFHRAVNFGMCDGSVHSIAEGTDESIVAALMSIDGSEIISDIDWQ